MVSLLGTCDFLGLTPSASKPRVLVMALINLIFFVACLCIRTTFYGSYTTGMRFIDVLLWSSALIFLGFCYGLTFKRSVWEDLASNLDRIDERGINRWLVANLIWGSLIPSIETFAFYNDGMHMVIIAYTCLYLYQYYQILYIELIITLLKVLIEKYRTLDERISNIPLSDDGAVTLKNVAEAYAKLNGLVKCFNEVFGYQMFVALVSYCLNFLFVLTACTVDILEAEGARMIFVSTALYVSMCTVLLWRMLPKVRPSRRLAHVSRSPATY